MKTYKLKVTVLSPVHIGDGIELEPLEYVIDNNLVYRIDLTTFLSTLSENEQNRFITFIKSNNLVEVRNFIKKNFNPESSPYLWYSRATGTFNSIYKAKFDQIANQLKIDPFIRSNNKPYIPGSSLKGALRTALLNKWSERVNNDELYKGAKDRDKLIEGKILNAIKSRDGKDSFDIDRDPFKALYVTDAFLPDNSTFFAKVSNFHFKGDNLEETNIQIFKEVTYIDKAKKDIEFELEIRLKNELFEKNNLKFTLDDILNASKEFYTKVLKSERDRLFKNKNDTYELYEQILKQAKNGYLCRIGFGSGFESITIEKFREPKTPKKGKPGTGWGYSKHLVESKYPMGFIKLEKV